MNTLSWLLYLVDVISSPKGFAIVTFGISALAFGIVFLSD